MATYLKEQLNRETIGVTNALVVEEVVDHFVNFIQEIAPDIAVF